VSLNLKVREQERTALDKERLARENTRRAAHGLKPLTSVDEINDEEAADVVLTEASQIVADMTSLPLLAQASKGS
jgi:hypothetical protein